MTRLGWTILSVIALAVVGFAALVRVGGQPAPPAARVPIPPVAAAPLVVPVAGVARAALRDDWGEARGGGARAHHALDIPAPAGAPVLAAAAGRVEKLFRSARGGATLYERAADERTMLYYAHLSGYAPRLAEGQVVRAGEPIGFVGDSGDAAPGDYHLHFEVMRTAPGAGWWLGEDVDPYPLLAGRPARR